MITIKITELYGEKKQAVSSHRTNDKEIAIGRAVKKHYGNKCCFFNNHERSSPLTRYGQIGHPIATNQMTMDTGIVQIDID